MDIETNTFNQDVEIPIAAEPQPQAFDFGAEVDTVAKCDAGAEIELKNPVTTKGTGVFIKVLGKDSTVFRNHIKEEQDTINRRNHELQRKGKKVVPTLSDETEQKAIEILVLCTLGWRTETRDDKGNVIANDPFIMFKGEKLSYSVANANRIYRENLEIRRQIDEGIADLENFI